MAYSHRRAFGMLACAYECMDIPAGLVAWALLQRPDLIAAIVAAQECVTQAFAAGSWHAFMRGVEGIEAAWDALVEA